MRKVCFIHDIIQQWTVGFDLRESIRYEKRKVNNVKINFDLRETIQYEQRGVNNVNQFVTLLFLCLAF